MTFNLRNSLVAGLALVAASASAQQLKDGYISWGVQSEKFHEVLNAWTPGAQVNEDDNFFISRVKPHQQFRNTATQVRQNLDATNDKNLIAWVPVGDVLGNALPNGRYDGECFTMWPYVTHWGDWTAPLGRVPAAFLDVAHKNGVGVSSVASIPNSALASTSYQTTLVELGKIDPQKAAQFFAYYGVDGMGYNSEFSSNATVLRPLRNFHAGLVREMRKTNPLFTNFWYDGTNDNGGITFDQGLGNHNKETFGDGSNIRTSLFLNYNWNRTSLLATSAQRANALNRSSLDLYAGVNMQGGEPRGTSWTLLKDYPLSIGLWGAHSNNMFWETRGERGGAPELKQRTYQLRIEKYFTGGTRNPANCPAISNLMGYGAGNNSFHGMSSMMTARSALNWNLTDEPFITYFNVGNGKFFNYKGVRQHDLEWYNVGIQDYLPTWHFWFADKLLGRTAADVPANGLDAEFSWDAAYFGGSCLRIYGSAAQEYLHLFKTKYALQAGDVITVRYALAKGAGDMKLVLTAEGAETTEYAYDLMGTAQEVDDEEWVEKTFTVDGDLAGKTLALVALKFQNAADLNLYLGEFSIIRGTAPQPAAPVIDKRELLAFNKDGVDAKIIFHMPNTIEGTGTVCYNSDVNVSMFKLWAQEKGKDPILVGCTTSWAGMYYHVPVAATGTKQVRLGVSAVSMDHKDATESDIAWAGYQKANGYAINDDIVMDKNTVKPGEEFTIAYADKQHELGNWSLKDNDGNTVYSSNGVLGITTSLDQIGMYTLQIQGTMGKTLADGTVQRKDSTSVLPCYVQITPETIGAMPEIRTFTANGAEDNVSIAVGEKLNLAYTGRPADGASSQGVSLEEQAFGPKASDAGIAGQKSWSLGFWIKINKFSPGNAQLLAVADKSEAWPNNNWGWLWLNVGDDGVINQSTHRGGQMSGNNEYTQEYGNTKLPVGKWIHLAFSFEWNGSGGLRKYIYLNGVKQMPTVIRRTTPVVGEDYTTPDAFVKGVIDLPSNHVVSIGGNAFGRNGIDGIIDNVVLWDKAVTEADVKTAMGDISASNVPAGIAALWDFEQQAGANFCFTSAGTKQIPAGMQEYVAAEGEGRSIMQWMGAKYDAGSPFLSGNSFPVVTEPVWKARKATFISKNGNDTQGQAQITYANDGDYTATLTLQNTHGSDQRTINVIHVGAGTGINTVGAAGEATAYTVGEDAIIEFAEGGAYKVSVYGANGQAEAAKAANIGEGQTMNIHLRTAGLYIVKIEKDGKTVRTVKLIRK